MFLDMSTEGFGITEWIMIAGGALAILALLGGLVMSITRKLQSFGLAREAALIITVSALVGISLFVTYKTQFFSTMAYFLRGGV